MISDGDFVEFALLNNTLYGRILFCIGNGYVGNVIKYLRLARVQSANLNRWSKAKFTLLSAALFQTTSGWSGGAIVLGELPVSGCVLLICIGVGQGRLQ